MRNCKIWILHSNEIFNIRRAVCQQLSWTFDKCLRGHCPIVCNHHQMGRWISTWPNITGRWPPCWTASWDDHGWLLPCCWNTDDGRSTSEVLQIARVVDILYGSILNILHDHLGLGKVFENGIHVFWRHFRSHFRWKRVQNCWLSTVPTQTTFCPAYVTGNEPRSHHWDLVPKQESMHWKHANSPPPRKFRTQLSTGKSGHNFVGLRRCAAGGLPSTLLQWTAEKTASGS